MAKWFDSLMDALFEPAVEPDSPPKKSNDTRTLTATEINDYLDAVQEAPKDREGLREYFRSRYPYRWGRMQRDLKHFKRKARRLGLNPEDFPWLL